MTHAALIIIDMQKAYFQQPELGNKQHDLIARCNELITIARDADMPIYVVRTEHASDQSTWTLNMKQDGKDFLLSGSEEVQVVDGLDVKDSNEIVKTRDSAFFETSLASSLQRTRKDTVILCGVSTQSCIAQSAADAYAADFNVILAVDAITSHDEALHKPFLDFLQKEYRQPCMSNNDIVALMASKES